MVAVLYDVWVIKRSLFGTSEGEFIADTLMSSLLDQSGRQIRSPEHYSSVPDIIGPFDCLAHLPG